MASSSRPTASTVRHASLPLITHLSIPVRLTPSYFGVGAGCLEPDLFEWCLSYRDRKLHFGRESVSQTPPLLSWDVFLFVLSEVLASTVFVDLSG